MSARSLRTADNLDLDDEDDELEFTFDTGDADDVDDDADAGTWQGPATDEGLTHAGRGPASGVSRTGLEPDSAGRAPGKPWDQTTTRTGPGQDRSGAAMPAEAGPPTRPKARREGFGGYTGDRGARREGKRADRPLAWLIGPEAIDWTSEYLVVYKKSVDKRRDKIEREYYAMPAVQDLAADLGPGHFYFQSVAHDPTDGVRRGGQQKRHVEISWGTYVTACKAVGIEPRRQTIVPQRLDSGSEEEGPVSNSEAMMLKMMDIIASRGSKDSGGDSQIIEMLRMQIESLREDLRDMRQENRELQNKLLERSMMPGPVAANNPEMDQIRNALVALETRLGMQGAPGAQQNPMDAIRGAVAQSQELIGLVASIGTVLSPSPERKAQWLEVIEGLSNNADGIGTLIDVAANGVQRLRGKDVTPRVAPAPAAHEKLDIDEDDDDDSSGQDWRKREYQPVSTERRQTG